MISSMVVIQFNRTCRNLVGENLIGSYMQIPKYQREEESSNAKRSQSFGLGALFFVMAMCAIVWSIVGMPGGAVVSFALSWISLAFLAYCIVSVASGSVTLESAMALSAAVFFMCLTPSFAPIESGLGLYKLFRSQETKHSPPKAEPPTEYSNLLGVSDAGAPNELLLQWQYFDDVSPIKFDPEAIKEIYTTVESFDCSPYILDAPLKQMLLDAPRLKWLRIGLHATSDDFRWICQMKNLRGLSMRYAKLDDVDLKQLRELKDLQWLDFAASELPPANRSQLPGLSRLEALFLDGTGLTDEHLPAAGQFPALRAISLSQTKISDKGLRRLIQDNLEIGYLNLSQTRSITRDSVPELAKLKELKFLHVHGTTLLKQLYVREYDGLPELQRRLPQTFIGVGD